MQTRAWWGIVMAWALGCGSAVPSESETGASSSSSSSQGSTTTPAETTEPTSSMGSASSDPTVDPSTTGTSGSSEGGDTEGASSSGGLIEWCDIFAQDCPDGQRCVPWANDGGASWNSTRCVPIAQDPAAIGEACTAEGDPPTTGVDNCELGAMCWNIGEDGEGRCTALCSGSPENPVCTQEDTWCSISAAGPLALCLETCDPLQSEAECEDEQVCVVTSQNSTCAPDASQGAGEQGDPCEFLNACTHGLGCFNPLEEFCDPTEASGCCLPYCDLNDPLCPKGLECIPAFEEHETLGDLGVCYVTPE